MELNLAVLQLSFAAIFFVPMRPAVAWQSAEIDNGVKLRFPQRDDLGGNLPITII